MIILSILFLMMGLLFISLIIHVKNLSCKLNHLQDEIGQLFYKMGISDGNFVLMKKEIKDIKEEMVGYGFALKTFEDYMKAKLEDMP